MTVQVNGQPRDMPEGSTVADLLVALELPPTGVAVAVNRTVVPRSQHAARTLEPGATVEILRAVGGG